jgi:hypothetical protein
MNIHSESRSRNRWPLVDPHYGSFRQIWPLLLIGLAMVAGGFLFYYFVTRVSASWDSVDATISEINTLTQDDAVYVDYTYKGASFTHVLLNSYQSTWYVGKVIRILVNPAAPGQIQSADAVNVIPWIIMGIGGAIAISGLGFLVFDTIHTHPFVPRKNPANLTEARLVGIEREKKGSRFVLLFHHEGDTYKSVSCRGEGKTVESILSNHEVKAKVYLDSRGHFTPDYPLLVTTLNEFKQADQLKRRVAEKETRAPGSNPFAEEPKPGEDVGSRPRGL